MDYLTNLMGSRVIGVDEIYNPGTQGVVEIGQSALAQKDGGNVEISMGRGVNDGNGLQNLYHQHAVGSAGGNTKQIMVNGGFNNAGAGAVANIGNGLQNLYLQHAVGGAGNTKQIMINDGFHNTGAGAVANIGNGLQNPAVKQIMVNGGFNN